MSKHPNKLFLLICISAVLWGCDPLTVHKITSTIFDGVPSMPEAGEYCRDYHEHKLAEESEAVKQKKMSGKKEVGSAHPPYAEKQCERCHDKTKDSGLIKPINELCFVCHPKIISKQYVHGPASVGSCLECHEPHTSSNPSLLKLSKAEVCIRCHKEKRVAEALHTKVAEKGMFCSDCHDPHAGAAKYFLR